MFIKRQKRMVHNNNTQDVASIHMDIHDKNKYCDKLE
jgi:hypothetical protein